MMKSRKTPLRILIGSFALAYLTFSLQMIDVFRLNRGAMLVVVCVFIGSLITFVLTGILMFCAYLARSGPPGS